jgi:DNA (cytosine-5)-methyltransferase 3A
MNVLSLFDGMACGKVALDRAGIKVDSYFASEIDKYAIQVAKKNHPSIIELGNITNWETWQLPKIDLILAGSPCQGFSNAGKGLNFDDTRSKLFFIFVEILKELKPKFFLLENVKMKKEWRETITSIMEVEPILINSSLVSAQNRERYYWTNIPNVSQPADKGILLKDVLLSGEILIHNIYGGFNETEPRIFEGKSPTLRTPAGGGHIPSVVELEKLNLSDAEKIYMDRVTRDGRNHWDFGHHSDTKKRKSQSVVANFMRGISYNVLKDLNVVRKLHPVECERLQTLEDKYTEGVSNTNRYKMIGNGWTVDVIAHILKCINESSYKEIT